MSRHWAGLDRELDAWAEAGRTATFWWRDDDAAERTRALDRLLDLAERTGTPIGIAVIPAAATSALVSHLDVHPRTTILQHGWAHVNHALAGAKRAELGGDRPIEAVRNDIARGRSRLHELLGRPAPPYLVPPWNRIAPEVASGLPSLGFRGLSTYGPRSAGRKCGLARVNCHIDPIDWRGTRRYVGEERAVQEVVRHLRARLERRLDPDEPTGLLTHHLVADDGCWEFAEALLERTTRHGAARWLTPEAAFLTDSGAA